MPSGGKAVSILLDSVTVPTVDLARVVLHARKALARHHPRNSSSIVAKIDIETSEYAVMPHMIISQAVCSIDILLMEWHAKMLMPNRLRQNPHKLSPSEAGISLLTGFVGMLESWVNNALSSPLADCRTELRDMRGNTMSPPNIAAFRRAPWPGVGAYCPGPPRVG